jgi:8-oxo-dGTP pyrophosphatase MutT (NUDIX family)
MSFQNTEQLPIRIPARRKSDVRTQFAALCYRIVDGSTEICLVTTRGAGRWTLPKGWPMDGQTPAAAAAMEAFEEAGLTGRAFDRCVGVYSYVKPLDRSRLPCIAMVFPVLVEQEHEDWPEKRQRKRKWFSLKKAAGKLDGPELQHIVQTFDPATLAS